MNDDILHLFRQYLLESTNPVAAAMLTLADVIESKGPVSVNEAARRLNICIPVEEIKRLEEN